MEKGCWMDIFWKVIMTLGIWLACIILAIVAGDYVTSFSEAMQAGAMALGAPLLATFFVWGIPAISQRGHPNVEDQHAGREKPKRRAASEDRMALLMDLMTEDEREAFKQVLKRQILAERRLTDDGEFVMDSAPLGSLLYEDSEYASSEQ